MTTQPLLVRHTSCSSESDDPCNWYLGPTFPSDTGFPGSLEYLIYLNNFYTEAYVRLRTSGYKQDTQEVKSIKLYLFKNRDHLQKRIYSIESALTRTLVKNEKAVNILGAGIWEFFRHLGISKKVVNEHCAEHSLRIPEDKVKELIFEWVKHRTDLATEDRIIAALIRLEEDHPHLKLADLYNEYITFAKFVDQGVQAWEVLSLGHTLVPFTYDEIKKITNNLSQRIDSGGSFGEVFKGKYQGFDIAVKDCKYISLESQQSKFCKIQFKREQSVAKLRHPYVIPVIGFCETIVDDKHYLSLVYPYMEKGDLSKHVSSHQTFSQNKRLKVLYQSACGLLRLHRGDIIHRDVKLRNILLDPDYNARVADTGSSRPISSDKSHLTSSNMGGTMSYTDPDIFGNYFYKRKLQFRKENDVYSLGIVIAQIIAGISDLNETLTDILHPVYHEKIDQEVFHSNLESLVDKEVWEMDALNILIDLVWQCMQCVLKRVKLQDVCDTLEEICTNKGIKLFDDSHNQYCVCCLVNARPETETMLYPVTERCNKSCLMKLCTDCMKNQHDNELHCPDHGPIQSCIGHSNSIAILLAGPGIKRKVAGGNDDVDIAFDMNANEICKILTDKNCFNLRKENVFLLHPEYSDTIVEGIRTIKINRENLKRIMEEIREKCEAHPNTTLMLFCLAHCIPKEVLVDGKKCTLFYITGCEGDETFLVDSDPKKKKVPTATLR